MIRPGDLILWGCNPDRSERTRKGQPVAVRRALLMVVTAEHSRATVRLVQDFGGVEENKGVLAGD